MKSRSVAGSIDCDTHEEDVSRRKKKLTEK